MAAAGEIQHSPTQGERGYTLKTALVLTGSDLVGKLTELDLLVTDLVEMGRVGP